MTERAKADSDVVAPAHDAGPGRVGPLAPDLGAGGVLLAAPTDGGPPATYLPLFTERGCRVVVVGVPLAVLIALRSLAAGADVAADVSDRAPWQRLLEAEGAPLARRLQVGSPRPRPPDFLTPLLHVRDAAPVDARDRAAAWSCRLEVVPAVVSGPIAATRSADLVVAGRLDRDMAVAVQPVLRLSTRDTERLVDLHDDEVAVVGQGRVRVVVPVATAWERSLLRLLGRVPGRSATFGP